MRGSDTKTRRARSSVVLSTVLSAVFALAVPLAGAALANHGARTLDLTPEVADNAVGSTHTITATLSAAADGASGTIQVDFEITGDADGDDTTPPDLECVIVATDTDCTVDITSATVGSTTVRGWIDHDGLNTTFDGDATELQDATGAGAGDNTNEPDITDVVTKTWFTGLPAGSVLDCIQEDEDPADIATNPIDAPANAETYTCTLMTSAATPAPVPGIAIDGENLNGANDPDNSAAAGTADMNNVCTTDATGTCEITVTAAETQLGTADLCFWADADADTAFDPAGPAEDGGECGEAVGAANTNQTDKVNKTWEARAIDAVDVSPVTDVNQKGTAHSVTVTVLDQFGDPIPAGDLEITVTGRNAGEGISDVATNAQGVYTFTYTDANAAGEGNDVIEACVDADDSDTCDVGEATATADKRWIDEPAVAADIELDMEGCDGLLPPPNSNLADASWDAEAAAGNVVDNTHLVCATAVTAGGEILYGAEITFTSTGVGEFVDSAGDSLGTTTTVAVDSSGYAQVELYSAESGTQTVAVANNGQTDTGTKEWNADDSRNLSLDPETARNEPGSLHLLSATVTDRLGNGVPGITVTFTETGTGAFRDGSSSVTAVTDADGVATAETTTLASEEGTQTISASISGTGPTNDCDLAADDPNTGDPAGNCTDDATKIWGPTCAGFETDARNHIVGTRGSDVIRGTDGDDIICGRGGDDVLRGAQGNDLILGQRGDDTMKGGDGDDRLRGGRGPDAAWGNAGTDTCRSARVQKGCEN